jgi:hypothetical protein
LRLLNDLSHTWKCWSQHRKPTAKARLPLRWCKSITCKPFLPRSQAVTRNYYPRVRVKMPRLPRILQPAFAQIIGSPAASLTKLMQIAG